MNFGWAVKFLTGDHTSDLSVRALCLRYMKEGHDEINNKTYQYTKIRPTVKINKATLLEKIDKYNQKRWKINYICQKMKLYINFGLPAFAPFY